MLCCAPHRRYVYVRPVRASGHATRDTLPQLRVARKGDSCKAYTADKHSPGPVRLAAP